MEITEKLDLKKIEDIEFDGIDHHDSPDYCDAFICRASYEGRELTEDELNNINDNERDFVYEKLMNYLY